MSDISIKNQYRLNRMFYQDTLLFNKFDTSLTALNMTLPKSEAIIKTEKIVKQNIESLSLYFRDADNYLLKQETYLVEKLDEVRRKRKDFDEISSELKKKRLEYL